jgi:putative transposase
VTDQVRERLAFWRGNVAAVHRELIEAARGGGPAAPSRQTLQRAVGRGDRVGLRSGELARRAHDVFLQRPRGHRNEVWEADHVEAPVEVDVEGRLIKPWVTWFVDTATKTLSPRAMADRYNCANRCVHLGLGGHSRNLQLGDRPGLARR